MENQDIFSDDQPVEEQTAVDNSLEDLLGEIKAEDGRQKYGDVQSALKSISPAQEHIKRLEAEMAEMRKQLEGTKSLDEVVNQLRNEFSQKGQTETPKGNPLDVDAVIDARLQAREAEAMARANVDKVTAKFKEVYGEKAKEQLDAVAARNGLGMDTIRDIARRSPEAIFNLAGITVKSSVPPKTTGSINTEAFKPVQQTTTEHKSIMGGASTKDMLNAWKSAGEGLTA